MTDQIPDEVILSRAQFLTTRGVYELLTTIDGAWVHALSGRDYFQETYGAHYVRLHHDDGDTQIDVDDHMHQHFRTACDNDYHDVGRLLKITY